MNLLAEAAGYWPLLLLPALFPLAHWVYRRDQRRRAGSIERHNKERGDK